MAALFRRTGAAKPPPSRPPDYHQYRDPTGTLSGRELGLALWFVKHRALLYRLGFWLLVAVSVASWGYSLVRFGSYLAQYPRHQQLQRELAQFPNYLPLHAVYAPAALEIRSVKLLPGGRTTFDAAAEAINPNERWLAVARYHFVIGGAETEPQEETVLPGRRQLLVQYGIAAAPAGGFTVVIDEVRWRRLSPRDFPNLPAWQDERLRFAVAEVNIRPGGTAPDSPLGTAIQFKLINQSAFSYRAPRFTVGLYAGSALVAVMPLELESFPSLAGREIDQRSFAPPLTAEAVEIFPRFNVYDPAVYLPPST
ncbi:MAG: hypothetical protein HYV42_05475 [Candidatus Magasanikbacteria bacterium]|nr:hypothetical protein [Candidatus Magasanikbacteria bacterium]